jgi:hypothetical protein
MFRNIIPTAWLSWNTIAAIGELLWFPVFFLIIRQNYKEKVCGMPITGICAVFVQCLIYASFGPYWRPDLFPHNPVLPKSFNVVWIWRGWLVVQGVVLVQFFLYHNHAKNPLELPVSEKRLHWAVAGLIVLNILAQWTFIVFYHDYNLNQSDPATYLILSIGFCLLALYRPSLKGLSYTVAWLKFIGTTLIFTTIVARPAESFGSMAMLALDDPVKAQEKACALPPVVSGQNCGLPPASQPGQPDQCEVMSAVCGSYTWRDVVAGQMTIDGAPVTDVNAVCWPTERWVLAHQDELESHGWDLTGPDTVYRSDVGELDLIRTQDPRGPVWCPQTTKWDLVDRVDGEWRFHFQFPVFMCFASIFFDGVYIYMVRRRLRDLRNAQRTEGAAST